MAGAKVGGETILMNADFRRPAARRGLSFSGFAEQGFSVLELLVIVVIVCVVVAIGVPTLHARAKVSVLEANLHSLGLLVDQQVAEGYSAEYRPSGEGDPAYSLSNRIEESLSAAKGKAGYRNPFVDSAGGRIVLNSSTAPTDPLSVPPAVLITDSPGCQYLVFNAQSDANRRLLVGTLIVAFNPGTQTVDVFFVKGDGQKSTNLVSVPTQ
jgi:hypothetical protein